MPKLSPFFRVFIDFICRLVTKPVSINSSTSPSSMKYILGTSIFFYFMITSPGPSNVSRIMNDNCSKNLEFLLKYFLKIHMFLKLRPKISVKISFFIIIDKGARYCSRLRTRFCWDSWIYSKYFLVEWAKFGEILFLWVNSLMILESWKFYFCSKRPPRNLEIKKLCSISRKS